MSSNDSASKSPMPGLDLAGVGGLSEKQAAAFMEMQRGIYSLVENANRNWIARAETERNLATELAVKLSNAKTFPDAAKAYQEWMTGRMQTLSADGQRFVADSQKLLNLATQFMSNGKQGPST